MNTPDWYTVAVIIGLTLVTVLARSFFLLSVRSWVLPHWAQRALHYAPIAALAAVVVPEIVTVQGQLVTTWQDARLVAALGGILAFWWWRDVLYTIIAGMALYLPLHVVWGW